MHIVEPETLTSIAHGLGLPDYRSLYDSDLNPDFRLLTSGTKPHLRR